MRDGLLYLKMGKKSKLLHPNGQGLKDPCGGRGQYKVYKSIIFIEFICKSYKVKPKMLSCVRRLCSANQGCGSGVDPDPGGQK